MARAYIALGSNLGDRAGYLAFARAELARLADTVVRGVSTAEETEPLGGADQPSYLNQMVAVDTALTPRALLDACLAIEAAAGRVRNRRWESRTLDLDLVSYDELDINEADLVVPHPGLADRTFWRRELAELAHRGL